MASHLRGVGGLMSDWDDLEEDATETTYAQGRLANRLYASRSFPLKRTNSADDGTPARFVSKVFDPGLETEAVFEGDEWTIRTTPAGRYQVKLLVAREAGNVKQLWIQRVPADGATGAVKVLLNLQQPELGRLIELIRVLDSIPVEGEQSVRVDDSLLHDLFADPGSLERIYRSDESRFRGVIASDETAHDVIALAARRLQVERFRRLMTDPEYFDAEALARSSGERVWQEFFERNPWIFGLGLGSQFLTSWNEAKLEQVLVGSSVTSPGKRVDAAMRTAGRIRSLVLAEIKTHRTPLLATREYRSGCWAPSDEVAGGVAQIQGTVHRAVEHIGRRLATTDPDGSEVPGDFTYLVRPRSFLVVGDLQQLTGAGGGDHPDRVLSFELFRRQTLEPEVVTFDELLARADWTIDVAAAQATESSQVEAPRNRDELEGSPQ